ncbi:MAG: EamA family transporter [Chloroflexota bacterium]
MFDALPSSRATKAGRLRVAAGSVPPTGLVILSIASVQFGAGIAKHLFPALGPGGTVFLRVGFAAVLLVLVWRPQLKNHTRSDLAIAALFGISLAAMNFSFYSALERLPLGIGVTLEFVGPLGVAIVGSRRLLDLLWAILAGAGIVLLAPWGGLHLDPFGVALALTAGAWWAAYIFLSARVGQTFQGGSGLTLAMVIGSIVLLPVGVVTAGSALLDPKLLLAGAGVALLSSFIPYSLELEALRRLPTRVFGVLMSLEPATAALVGFVVLRETLSLRAWVAVFLVSAASFCASRYRETVIHDP